MSIIPLKGHLNIVVDNIRFYEQLLIFLLPH